MESEIQNDMDLVTLINLKHINFNDIASLQYMINVKASNSIVYS